MSINSLTSARRLPNRDEALKALYDDVYSKSMFPFWATTSDVAQDEIKQLLGHIARDTVPLALRGGHRTNSGTGGGIGHDGPLRTPLAHSRQSGSRPEAGIREHDVHSLSSQRCQRNHAAASAFTQFLAVRGLNNVNDFDRDPLYLLLRATNRR